jgi:alpha-amylase
MVDGSRILMWLNYRQNGNGEATIAVPAPVDPTTPDAPWWYDRICTLAPELARIGITDVLFPNPVIGQGAPGPGDDGYNPFDDYDIGGKGTPTRSGTREQLQRAVAVCHANGLNVLLDVVMHQRMGGRDGSYVYRSATGPTNGRFPKTPTCFRWNGTYGVTGDMVPVPADDFPFGDELCPQNALPTGYVATGLIAANQWLFDATGADGGRLDDMKGMNVAFMNAFLAAPFARGKFWFGEYDDGNTANLNWYEGQIDGRMSLVDFAFQENLIYPMTMQSDSWDMSWGVNQGLIRSNPLKAIPFVESMDSDTDGWATIINNKSLGIAALLTSEGLPLVYIKDYLVYGLEAPITNLAWISRMLCEGGTDCVYADAKTLIYRRTGSPGVLVALNNDIWNPAWTTVTCRADWAPGTVLKDYTGKNTARCQVQPDGQVTFGIPPAANGAGYGCWAPDGVEGVPSLVPRTTTQVFEGAADLDIGPAIEGTLIIAPRLWVAMGTALVLALTPAMTGWPNGAELGLVVSGPDGKALGALAYDTQGAATQAFHVTTTAAGWHQMALIGTGLPTIGTPFTIAAHYLAPTDAPLTPTPKGSP